MRTKLPFWIALILVIFAAPAAHAQAQAGGNNFNVSWAALDPGNDWAAQMIQSVFPINGSACAGAGGGGGATSTCTGTAATVIGQIVGQVTGFVLAIAMAFVCYNTIMNIHRVAESANLFTSTMTSLLIVRIGFAAVMMYPLTSGFSVGQGAVVQASMWGIGMAKAVYANAVTALGPDALVIAQPNIPGTKTTVLNLLEDELCRALINQATNSAGSNPQMVPAPNPTTVSSTYAGATTFAYTLSSGNATGSPTCGTITVAKSVNQPQTIAGVNTDMTAQQATVLQNVLTTYIRPIAESVAASYWSDKKTADLTPLQTAYTAGTLLYTQELTAAASNITAQINQALTAQDARDGSVGLINNENQLSSLGWSAAGAYFLNFAQINGRTLSLLSALPVVNTPSYNGLPDSLKSDLAPVVSGANAFLQNIDSYVNTVDGETPPGANSSIFTGMTGGDPGGMVEQVMRAINITEPLLNDFTNAIAPSSNYWADPFTGLILLGQKIINASLGALGLMFAASSAPASTTVFQLLTGQWAAASATIAASTILSGLIKFFATPLFFGLLAMLIPGLTIAYVLPMIPWIMWMAGVAGYLILVCEAVIAVPLWMLAHMTFEGAGLHGRAIQGYELLFNILFRPVLMVVGLFLSYFIFTCMAWLINMTFGVAIHFVLENGWLVTNFLGFFVLLNIFVLAHVTSAFVAFRMIYLVPHHIPRLLGFSAAGRVDMDEFAKVAAWRGTAGGLEHLRNSVQSTLPKSKNASQGDAAGQNAIAAPHKQIAGPTKNTGGTGSGGIDSTLGASTDMSPPPPAD